LCAERRSALRLQTELLVLSKAALHWGDFRHTRTVAMSAKCSSEAKCANDDDDDDDVMHS